MVAKTTATNQDSQEMGRLAVGKTTAAIQDNLE